MIENGIFDMMIEIINNEVFYNTKSNNVLKNAVWTLANIVREKPKDENTITFKTIPVFIKVCLNCKDSDINIDALWAILQLSLIYLGLILYL